MTARKIIVGYDRSTDARAAATWALDEASRTGALVELFYAYEWPVWAPAASMIPSPAVWPDGETDLAIRGMLDEAVAAARQTHPGVRTAISIVHAGAALTLIDRSREAGLVVLGSRGHSGVANLLGSVSAAVTAHAHCPVVVVRGDPAPGAPVVAGIEDSDAAPAALAFALDQASARETDLHVIRACDAAVAGRWESGPMVTEAVLAGERARLDDLVDGWRKKFPDVTVTTEVVEDHPAAALIGAGASARMVVVGSRGRGAFRGMLLGSVSRHLLHHAGCTVAVVHDDSAT
jgi:nucleotide-binding universal stress UspA family protein